MFLQSCNIDHLLNQYIINVGFLEIGSLNYGILQVKELYMFLLSLLDKHLNVRCHALPRLFRSLAT